MTSTYSKSAVAWGDDFPLYLSHGNGSHVFDVDGNEYVDFSMALGCCPLGYRNPTVDAAIRRQLDSGIAFSLGTAIEAELCEKLAHTFGPHIVGGADQAMVALGKNGSDATALAVRLARTVTGRRYIHMRQDGYHGWHDWSLSGTSRGIGTAAAQTKEKGGYWAAAIVEPDKGEAECFRLRQACDSRNVPLIFDECVTGFRYPKLCGAAHYGIAPDILCLGKGLGNGMPISAVIARRELMERIAAGGRPNCFWSATHFGETLSIAAALAVLDAFTSGKACDDIQRLETGAYNVAAKNVRVPVKVEWTSLSRLSFPSPEYAQRFRREMARNGVIIYSAHNVSTAHEEGDMKRLARAYEKTMDVLADVPDDIKASAPMPARGVMRR
jgi:glutamate-1-semialdehyde 2,1-aminomutase